MTGDSSVQTGGSLRSTEAKPRTPRASPAERKPLMTTKQILLMNFGFLGIQYSFGMQQTAVNPIFGFLHAETAWLPLLNLAGPMTGLLIQPMIGRHQTRSALASVATRRLLASSRCGCTHRSSHSSPPRRVDPPAPVRAVHDNSRR